MTDGPQNGVLVRPQLSVLVVEDDDDDFLIARQLLASQNGWRFEVDRASTYEEALRVIDDAIQAFRARVQVDRGHGIKLLLALGTFGAHAIAAGIAISTVGFLSQSMLTAPRVYFAMARDGLFFKSVGALHPRTRVPIVAIGLQGLLAIAIALWGGYEQILNYVVSMDFIFFGLTACCIFVFRRQRVPVEVDEDDNARIMRVPGHPFTTLLFVAACWLVVINTIYKYPSNTLIGMAILIAGIPAYMFWRWRNKS